MNGCFAPGAVNSGKLATQRRVILSLWNMSDAQTRCCPGHKVRGMESPVLPMDCYCMGAFVSEIVRDTGLSAPAIRSALKKLEYRRLAECLGSVVRPSLSGRRELCYVLTFRGVAALLDEYRDVPDADVSGLVLSLASTPVLPNIFRGSRNGHSVPVQSEPEPSKNGEAPAKGRKRRGAPGSMQGQAPEHVPPSEPRSWGNANQSRPGATEYVRPEHGFCPACHQSTTVPVGDDGMWECGRCGNAYEDKAGEHNASLLYYQKRGR